MSLSEELLTADQSLINNYNRAPVVMSRGEGCVLWDADGRRFLDMTAGIAVCVLGHGHAGLGAGYRSASRASASRLESLLS